MGFRGFDLGGEIGDGGGGGAEEEEGGLEVLGGIWRGWGGVGRHC